MTRIALASALPFAFLVAVSLAGADFGSYWDDEAMFTKVRRALAPPPTLLPNAYDYPGVTFLMSVAALAPEALADPSLRRVVPDTSGLDSFTRSETYRIRTRSLFAIVSSLAVVWIAALSVVTGGNALEAFLASAFFAASWEVGYHLRWIAPDGVTAMLVVATVTCAAAALRASERERRWWLRGGAILAGLATGSKYSAWPAVLAIAAVVLLVPDGTRPIRLRELAQLAAMSVAAFLVVSPGTLLQPTLAASQIRAQAIHYATAHGIYTVGRGFEHLTRMLAYDLLVLPSPYVAVAVGCSAASMAGAAALIRQSPRTAVVVIGFPVFFTAYFALQRVMIVRNLLVIAPFAAVLAARGVRIAWQSVGRYPIVGRAVLAIAVGLALALNIAYQVSAVASVRARASRSALDEFQAWRSQQPHGSIQTAGRLAQVDHDAAPAPADATVAVYALDAVHAGARPNGWRTFARVFGPREVNLNYYPDWPGEEHIVLMSRAEARGLGIVEQ